MSEQPPALALMAQDAFSRPSGIARYQGELIRWLAPRVNLSLLVPRGHAYGRGALLPPEARAARVLTYGTAREVARSAPQVVRRLLGNGDLLSLRPLVCLNTVSSRLFSGVYADRRGFDLVHGTGGFLPDTRGKTRRVVSIHDTTPITMPQRHTRLTRGLFMRPRELRRDDYVIVGTQSALQEFHAAFPHPDERTRVIPYGFDAAAFSPGPTLQAPEGNRYLLSVGAIEPRKNLVRGLEAFERLAKGHAGLRWKVAGPKEWGWKEFEKALAASPARGQVDLMGPVPEGQLPDLYRGAACLFYPSLWEGFGYPVLEALSCGTPVAASDLPSLREAGDSAFVAFEPTDVQAMADAVERAAFDEGGRAERRQAGIAHAKTFSWSRCAAGHLGVYAEALGVEPEALLRPGAPAATNA